MKRPASIVAPSARKAAKGASNELKEKCSSVVAVLPHATAFDDSVIRMLGGMARFAFTPVESETGCHPYQATVAGMIEQLLKSIDEQAEAGVHELQAKVDNVYEDRKDRQDRLGSSEQALLTANGMLEKAEAEVSSSSEALAAAKKALAVAEAARKSGGTDAKEAEGKKSKLEDAQRTVEEVKSRKAETAEAKALAALGGDFGFDPSFLQALPPVLKKEPSDRQGFDLVTLEQLTAELGKALAEQNGIIEAGAPEMAERDQAVASAKAAFDEATSKQAEAKDALKSAKESLKEATMAAKGAAAAVASFFADTKTMMDEYDDKRAWLAAFRGSAGALASFRSLTTPKPPMEAEAVAEETSEAA